MFPGNSKARPLLKPTTVKVTGNCGTTLVKRLVCFQLVSAPFALDAELEEAFTSLPQDKSLRGPAFESSICLFFIPLPLTLYLRLAPVFLRLYE